MRFARLIFALGLFPFATVAPPGLHGQEVDLPDLTITPDVVYGHKDGMALTFDVIQPAHHNGAAVLFMVSGGWVSWWSPPDRLAANVAPGLLRSGFTVFAVRHGSAPRYKVPEAEADVRSALQHVVANASTFAVDPSRLGVFGGSAGGHLSLMLGLTSRAEAEGEQGGPAPPSPVAAVVAYYPPVDLRPIVGPSERFPALDFPAEQAASISPILFASADDPPTLLIHGDADALVGLRNSVIMQEALEAEGVDTELIVIEGGDHGFRNPAHQAEAQAAMVAWFEEHLAPPVPSRGSL